MTHFLTPLHVTTVHCYTKDFFWQEEPPENVLHRKTFFSSFEKSFSSLKGDDFLNHQREARSLFRPITLGLCVPLRPNGSDFANSHHHFENFTLFCCYNAMAVKIRQNPSALSSNNLILFLRTANKHNSQASCNACTMFYVCTVMFYECIVVFSMAPI